MDLNNHEDYRLTDWSSVAHLLQTAARRQGYRAGLRVGTLVGMLVACVTTLVLLWVAN